MSRWKLLAWHLLAYALLTLAFIFPLSEHLVGWIFPGYHRVEIWLVSVVVGSSILFVMCCASLLYWTRRTSRR